MGEKDIVRLILEKIRAEKDKSFQSFGRSRFLKEGEFFREMSSLEECLCSAEAAAAGKTEVFKIFRPDLFDLIENNPKLGYRILLRLSRGLASRLRETTERKGMKWGRQIYRRHGKHLKLLS